MSRRSRNSGFTVVELLVALTILGLVISALVGAADTARRLLSSIDDADRQYAEAAQLRGMILDALRQVTRPPISTGTVSLFGNQRTLTMISVPPRPLGAVQPMLLNLAPDGDENGLMAAWRPVGDQSAIAPFRRRMISTNSQVRFEFYTPDLGWSDTWDRETRLPTALRVRIASIGGRRANTVLLLGIRSVVSTQCSAGLDAKLCGSQP